MCLTMKVNGNKLQEYSKAHSLARMRLYIHMRQHIIRRLEKRHIRCMWNGTDKDKFLS
jgi:hypothetical protein